MRMLLASGDSFIEGMADGTVALLVLITGLVVVFLMLIALTLIIKIYGTIVYNVSNRKKEAPKSEPVSAPAPLPQKAVVTAPAPAVEDGIPGEVVAAIAAAVYCVEGVSFSAVKSIRRAKAGGSRSAWGMAGVLDNTRPF